MLITLGAPEFKIQMGDDIDLIQLVYVSSVCSDCDTSMLRQIARDSRSKNMALGITGILLIYNDTVMQFLEGPSSTVKGLFETIKTDPRHKMVIQLSCIPVKTREFPNWKMGYKEISEANDPDFVFRIGRDTGCQELPESLSAGAKSLINSFKLSSGLVPSKSSI